MSFCIKGSARIPAAPVSTRSKRGTCFCFVVVVCLLLMKVTMSFYGGWVSYLTDFEDWLV